MTRKYDANPARARLDRRDFFGASASAAAFGLLGLEAEAAAQNAAPRWNAGQVAHLIPTANHERFLIKASFKAPLAGNPRLTVDGKPIEGIRTDLRGRFFRFDVTSLKPATQYQLRITDAGPVTNVTIVATINGTAAPGSRPAERRRSAATTATCCAMRSMS